MKYLLCLLLTGCSVSVDNRSQLIVEATVNPRIDEELLPFIHDFELLFGARVQPSLSAYLMPDESFSGFAIGNCNYQTTTITIKKTYWDSMDVWDRKALMLHELGHCELFKDHNEDTLLDGTPASLMNHKSLDGEILKNNFTYYIEELFEDTEYLRQR